MLARALSAVAVVGIAVVSAKVAQKFMLKSRAKGKRAAVILSGNGFMDGAEVTESVATLVALSELDIEAVCFAPDETANVVDHNSGKALGYAPRHLMQEAARITRGNVKPLSELNVADFDALIMPGGFGVAKNLSNWATAESPSKVEVNKDVRKALESFLQAKKPIGLCCISPVLAAVCLPGSKITVGKCEPAERWPYGGTIKQIESLGSVHVPCEVNEIAVDNERKLVTTPAFMCETKKSDVFFGVRKMVRKVAWLMG